MLQPHKRTGPNIGIASHLAVPFQIFEVLSYQSDSFRLMPQLACQIGGGTVRMGGERHGEEAVAEGHVGQGFLDQGFFGEAKGPRRVFTV